MDISKMACSKAKEFMNGALASHIKANSRITLLQALGSLCGLMEAITMDSLKEDFEMVSESL